MAPSPRISIPGVTQHVMHRGNNRMEIFRSPSDYEFFLATLESASKRHQMDVHSYTLMTNHVHFLVTPRTATAVSRAMQVLGVNYVRHFNRRYTRTGTLFEGRYRSMVIDNETYWFTCMRYVELNPVRAGLSAAPEAYRWSSYSANALGTPNAILVPHPLYLSLGESPAVRQQNWRAICGEVLSADQLAEIRDVAHHGGVLGRVALHSVDVSTQV
jgi:putative transposase